MPGQTKYAKGWGRPGRGMGHSWRNRIYWHLAVPKRIEVRVLTLTGSVYIAVIEAEAAPSKYRYFEDAATDAAGFVTATLVPLLPDSYRLVVAVRPGNDATVWDAFAVALTASPATDAGSYVRQTGDLAGDLVLVGFSVIEWMNAYP